MTDWRAWAIVASCLAAVVMLQWIDRQRLRKREKMLRERLGTEGKQVDGNRRDVSEATVIAEQEAQKALMASEQKSRFLAAASHDLRQPIHAITLFGSALAAEPLEGRTRYLVDRLLRSLSGLDELFNRLLDISRLDTGSIVPHWSVFSLAPVFGTLEARFGAMAKSRGIRFSVFSTDACQVRSDATLLVEMIMNLLSNAFRYTERGGVLLAARRRGQHILIQVWDTGRGIAPEHVEPIFGEFVQLDNPSRDRRKGLGLGLAIVRRLGQALDHPVAVRSRIGRGSVFEIRVPAAQAQPAAQPTSESQGLPDVSGLLVLAVDDEIDVLMAMEALLSGWGCYVLLARSLPEALERLATSERFPDVLLTDHILGNGVTSTQVIESVRAQVPIELSVAVVSGEAEPALESEAMARGCSYMTKPVNPMRLRAFLASAASR